MMGNSLIERNNYEMAKDGAWSWIEYEENAYGAFDDAPEDEYNQEDEALEIMLEYYRSIKEDLIDENLWD